MSEEGHSKTLLVGFIKRVKALADEIKELQADITDVCKEAKGAGFETSKIREVVGWLQKIDKHGREKVDAAEAIFDLYRAAMEGEGVKFDEMMDSARDRALLAVFAGESDQIGEQIHKRRKGVASAAALAKAAREARRL